MNVAMTVQIDGLAHGAATPSLTHGYHSLTLSHH